MKKLKDSLNKFVKLTPEKDKIIKAAQDAIKKHIPHYQKKETSLEYQKGVVYVQNNPVLKLETQTKKPEILSHIHKTTNNRNVKDIR
jgi:hypothetical protein